jgi:hypothetical protein
MIPSAFAGDATHLRQRVILSLETPHPKRLRHGFHRSHLSVFPKRKTEYSILIHLGMKTSSSSRVAPLRQLVRPPQACSVPFRRCLARTYLTSPTKPSANTHITSGGPQAPAEYCSSLVQRLDPEAWLCSYFWPRRERAWSLAWRAFNVSLPHQLLDLELKANGTARVTPCLHDGHPARPRSHSIPVLERRVDLHLEGR